MVVFARLVKAEFRLDSHLVLPAKSRVVQREIRCWMKRRSIIPWVELLAARKGPT